MLLWSSAHQLDYIPASPTLGCKSPPSRGARLRVSKESGEYVQKPDGQRCGAPAEEERGRFLESSGNCPLWFHYCATASPRWRSVKAVLLSLALVQLQLAHAWNWSRALGTGSGKKQAQHTERVLPRSWTRSRAPDSLSQSLSRSGLDPNVLEATGSGREKQQRQNTLTCLDVIQHAGLFLYC